jgi:hypothetical protein
VLAQERGQRRIGRSRPKTVRIEPVDGGVCESARVDRFGLGGEVVAGLCDDAARVAAGKPYWQTARQLQGAPREPIALASVGATLFDRRARRPRRAASRRSGSHTRGA